MSRWKLTTVCGRCGRPAFCWLNDTGESGSWLHAGSGKAGHPVEPAESDEQQRLDFDAAPMAVDVNVKGDLL